MTISTWDIVPTNLDFVVTVLYHGAECSFTESLEIAIVHTFRKVFVIWWCSCKKKSVNVIKVRPFVLAALGLCYLGFCYCCCCCHFLFGGGGAYRKDSDVSLIRMSMYIVCVCFFKNILTLVITMVLSVWFLKISVNTEN